MDDFPLTPDDFVSFAFHAHVVGTTRETVVTIRVRDTEDRMFVEMADEAEERAYVKAAHELRCDVSELEVMSC